jgi:hypothetical protein
MGGRSFMTPLLILLFGVHPLTAVGTHLLYAARARSARSAWWLSARPPSIAYGAGRRGPLLDRIPMPHASAEDDATRVTENCVRPRLGAIKAGKLARRNSVTWSGEETAVPRAAQCRARVGRRKRSEFHREYLRRANVQDWSTLNSTAFGWHMTMLVEQFGFGKRKEGKVRTALTAPLIRRSSQL